MVALSLAVDVAGQQKQVYIYQCCLSPPLSRCMFWNLRREMLFASAAKFRQKTGSDPMGQQGFQHNAALRRRRGPNITEEKALRGVAGQLFETFKLHNMDRLKCFSSVYSMLTGGSEAGDELMQQEKTKRGRDSTREEEEEEHMIAKKACKEGTRHGEGREDDIFKGVFDFPWLKEGTMISSASEDDWGSEATFLSSLHGPPVPVTGDGTAEFSYQLPLWIPASLPEEKVHEHDGEDDEERGWNFRRGDKLESFDCIWSSLLDQKPL